MRAADFVPLLPLLVIAGSALVVLLLLAIHRHHGAVMAITVVGLAVAGVLAVWVSDASPRPVTSLLLIDNYALFFTALACAAGIAIALVAYDYWRPDTATPEEFYLLLLSATLGAVVLASSVHFMSLFLGLEILSVSLYGMIAYRRADPLGIEGAIKYLILAAVSSAFLLFGMALIYAELGTMSFTGLARLPDDGTVADWVLLGWAMMLVGFGFKLALVPFHLWTPDVYQGAPAPTTAFVATVSKGAVFVLLLRIVAVGHIADWAHMRWVLAAVAVISMFTGNVLALRQPNVKRILAYSSIAHMGYLMVALIAGGSVGGAAVAFYLVAYFASMVGAFAVVAIVSEDGPDAGQLSQFRGLAWRHPLLATALSAMLFSLAGIPLTAGFLGKFYVLWAGVGASQWALATFFVVNSALGIYYYLRVVVTLFRSSERDLWGSTESQHSHVASPSRALPQLATGIALTGLCWTLIWVGVYPAPLIGIVRSVVEGMP